MTDSAEYVVKMTDNISISLHSMEFIDADNAIVTFELFAWPDGNGGKRNSLVKLQQMAKKAKNANGSLDYETIAKDAGQKLQRDFARIVQTLVERL